MANQARGGSAWNGLHYPPKKIKGDQRPRDNVKFDDQKVDVSKVTDLREGSEGYTRPPGLERRGKIPPGLAKKPGKMPPGQFRKFSGIKPPGQATKDARMAAIHRRLQKLRGKKAS